MQHTLMFESIGQALYEAHYAEAARGPVFAWDTLSPETRTHWRRLAELALKTHEKVKPKPKALSYV